MKTSKDKAKELVEKYYNCSKRLYYDDAVTCAKIAVDEIIQSPADIEGWGCEEDEIDFTNYFEYWQEVKNELNKMS